MIGNHGHIGVGEIDPEDIVEGYDPTVLRGQTPRQFISLMDAIGVELANSTTPARSGSIRDGSSASARSMNQG